jgi:hypothetical protein
MCPADVYTHSGMTRIAYSYVRFSTPKQAHGDTSSITSGPTTVLLSWHK